MIVTLPYYRCHKVVRAMKIGVILAGRADGKGPGSTLVSTEDPACEISVGEEYEAKHDPQEGGYLVVYEDGYQSYSPAAAFEAGYTRL